MSSANQSGNAYGLTALIPVINGTLNGRSYAKLIRDQLQTWPLDENSPIASIPNNYLSRFYLLNDVFYERYPANEEHLKSKYLVFSSNFHGDLDKYLEGIWDNADEHLSQLLIHCVAFDQVKDRNDFVRYIKRCQVENSLFFNGSTDDSLEEQLKSLYLKQAFTHFVYTHQPLQQQGKESAEELQQAFIRFVELTEPANLSGPSWKPGQAKEPDNLRASVEATYQPLSQTVPEA